MSSGIPQWMQVSFSAPRLASYLVYSRNEAGRAAKLYWWNVEISGAFYGPLHCLELSLRNALHERLSTHFGTADWWTRTSLQGDGPRLVDKARLACLSRRASPTPDRMVAELNFGFWVSLLARRYDRVLWVPALHKAFPGYRGPRQDLHDWLRSLLLLRNRIMHHEPIHYRHLEADHAKIYRMLSYVAPGTVDQIKPMDRVPHILSMKEAVCRGELPPRF